MSFFRSTRMLNEDVYNTEMTDTPVKGTGLREFASKRDEEIMYSEYLDSFDGDIEAAEAALSQLADMSLEDFEHELDDAEDGLPDTKKKPKENEEGLPELKEREEKPSFTQYRHSFELDNGKKFDVSIENETQLQEYIERGAIASQVFAESRELYERYQAQEEDAIFGKNLSDAIETRPHEVASDIINDMLFGRNSNPQAVLQYLSHEYHRIKAIAENPAAFNQYKMQWDSESAASGKGSELEKQLTAREARIREEETRIARQSRDREIQSYASVAQQKYQQYFDHIAKHTGDSQWGKRTIGAIMDRVRLLTEKGEIVTQAQINREIEDQVRPIYNVVYKLSKQPGGVNTSNKKAKESIPNTNRATGSRSNTKSKGYLDKLEQRIAESIYEQEQF